YVFEGSDDAAGTDIARPGEITPQRDESEILVEAPAALLSCNEGGLARRINEKSARYPRPRSILFHNHDLGAAGAVLREALGAHALANTHSCAPGIVEPQEIQRIPLDMQTWPVISEVAEGNLGDLIAPDHDPAGLLDIAVAFDRFADAEEVEIFPCRRQDAFTDGLARVMRFVDE